MNITEWSERYCKDSALKYPSKATQENYQCTVKLFLEYFKKETDPKHIKTGSIKEWLLTFQTINTRNHKLCAIKSFYEITVGMPLKLDKIPFSKKDKKLPEILDREEIQALFNVCANKKHKLIMTILYACGLRVGEILNLKLTHINKDTIDIKCAKGRKDRIVPLPGKLKQRIDEYIFENSPNTYLFNGQSKSDLRYDEKSINSFLKKYGSLAGIKTNMHAHKLRHCYATHTLEDGTTLPFLQEILGHSSSKTTSIYIHTSRASIARQSSPVDLMEF